MSVEQGETVVEASRGQRFAGWFLQVSGVIMLLFGGIVIPWWMIWLFFSLVLGGSIGEIAWMSVAIIGGSVILVVGSLMRTAGMMMRGRMDFRSGKECVRWALCSAGKVLSVVWAIGTFFSALGAVAHESLPAFIGCLVLTAVLSWLAGRFHAMRGRFVKG